MSDSHKHCYALKLEGPWTRLHNGDCHHEKKPVFWCAIVKIETNPYIRPTGAELVLKDNILPPTNVANDENNTNIVTIRLFSDDSGVSTKTVTLRKDVVEYLCGSESLKLLKKPSSIFHSLPSRPRQNYRVGAHGVGASMESLERCQRTMGLFERCQRKNDFE